jgi:DMSO/TMAO reductase YedYZ molybdopterin-dependent catalytic subunit
VRTFRGAWSLAGLVAGFAGLASSFFLAMAMTIRSSPVVAIAELVIRHTPGGGAERAIDVLGHHDKPFLVTVILVGAALAFAYAGRLARHGWWAPLLVLVVLALVAGVAVVLQHGSTPADIAPVVIGFLTWVLCLALLTGPLRRAEALPAPAEPGTDRRGAPDAAHSSRRGFLVRSGSVAVVGVALWLAGRVVGRGRRHVEETRRLLRLSGVTPPRVPARARLDVPGIAPWMTPADDFYRVDTAIVAPAIEPTDWSLRIHGMVERDVILTYADLVDRAFTESWITLNCVSNPVGGDLIGNAWWSGVRIADLLATAGVDPTADAVLQTSDDGWTCGTPLVALTDDRDAMLAVAMNGKPLPIDHGFPVRTVVPGLYGYVSACKWVVDLEVTRFSRITAFWTERGWAEKGPVKLASRIDVPRSGADVPAGQVQVAGVAWAQHTGIQGVEVAVDGGAWQPAEISHPPTDDSWVQWVATVSVPAGDHEVRVRATDKNGEGQTAVERGVLPDGATGWHRVEFSAQEA